MDVLERLAPIAPIVKKILDYRQIAKIQSTYVIGLQDWILADGKIHTRYVQDLTQTGRLSSVVQTCKISLCVWSKGVSFVRLLCLNGRIVYCLVRTTHRLNCAFWRIFLRMEHLIKAFQEGADIHTSTAMRVFGIERPEDVTANDRRNAKAVNFGVVYGISDFGLSNNLGISRKEAKAYIDTYFERFPGI